MINMWRFQNNFCNCSFHNQFIHVCFFWLCKLYFVQKWFATWLLPALEPSCWGQVNFGSLNWENVSTWSTTMFCMGANYCCYKLFSQANMAAHWNLLRGSVVIGQQQYIGEQIIKWKPKHIDQVANSCPGLTENLWEVLLIMLCQFRKITLLYIPIPDYDVKLKWLND